MVTSRKRRTPAQGVQTGDRNKQWNFFAPVTLNFCGEFERLQDACFDPTPLARDLDLDHFTGRSWLIDQIDAFVNDRRRGYVIIRAEAGVGKSTLAAHLVRTRPWLHHFTRLPGGRSPVAARKSLAAQLIRRWDLLDEWAPGGILPSAAARPDWFDRLLAAAAVKRDQEEPGLPIVVVVDGLDEADAEASGSGGLPLGLPASLPDGMFVVVTSRFGIERALHTVRNPADWLQIEVEGPGNLTDMRRFVEEVTTPEGGDRRLIDALGRAGVDPDRFRVTIAKSCAGVWIYLRYVLDEIRDGTMDPRGIGQLPGDLAGYYAEQVQRWRGNPEDEAAQHRWEQVRMPLLGVLAAARAPLTATELASFAGVQSVEATRAFVTETMRAFLNCSHEGQRRASSYTLRHQSLRDLLSGNVPAGRPDLIDLADMLATQTRTAHQRIASSLVPPGSPRERDWPSVGSYARQHLAAHADCELLDDLVCDPGFLLVTDPGALLTRRASLRTPDSKRALSAFDLSLSEKESSTDAERLSCLARNAARVHARALVTACAERSGEEWPTRWAAWAGQGHLRLDGNKHPIKAVAISRVADRDVVISASLDGSVRIWDAVTGDLLTEHTCADAEALGRVADRDVVISHSFGGSVRLWDAITGDLFTEHTLGIGSVNAVALGRVADRDVVVTGSSDGMVWIWDAVTCESIIELSGHSSPVNNVVIGRVGDRDVVIACAEGDSVRIWDVVTGELLGEPLTSPSRSLITGLGIGRAGDRDVIFIGISNLAKSFIVQILDVATSHPAGETLVVQEGDMETMAVGRVGNRDVIMMGFSELGNNSDNETTRRQLGIWDAATGHSIGKPLTIEGEEVWVMTAGRAGGRDIIVTGSQDGTVRILDASEEALVGHADGVSAVTIGRVNGQDVIVSCSKRDRSTRIWDVITGDLIGEPRIFELSWVDAITLGRIGDQNVIVHAPEEESSLQILDIITGHPIREPIALKEKVVSIALGRISERDVVVTASDVIRIWDAATGDLIRGPFTLEFSWDDPIAIGQVGDQDVILTGGFDSVMIWDASTGHHIREMPTGGELACAVTTGRLGDRDVVLAGLGTRVVQIWDAVTGRLIGSPLTGHDGAVTAVAAGRVGGRDLIVSGSDDRTVVLREHRSKQNS